MRVALSGICLQATDKAGGIVRNLPASHGQGSIARYLPACHRRGQQNSGWVEQRGLEGAGQGGGQLFWGRSASSRYPTTHWHREAKRCPEQTKPVKEVEQSLHLFFLHAASM